MSHLVEKPDFLPGASDEQVIEKTETVRFFKTGKQSTNG